MAVEGQSRWRTMLWVLSASIALHLVIVAIFFIPAAFKQPEPAPEENVSVELVPPPEDPKPDEKKPELPKPPEPKPEEKKPPEKPPEPPKAEKQPEPPKPETPPPPPPAPKPPEPPKPPEAPKPPPPKPPEAPKPPEPKPPEEKPPQQPKPEADKPNAQDTPAKSMLQPLRPVFKFGDKDTGPKKSDGNSADGETKPDDAAKPDDAKADPAPPKPTPPDQQPPPKADASEKPPADKPADKPVDDKPPAEKPSDSALTVGKPAGAGPLPPDINLPQVDAVDSNAEKNGAPGQAADAANVNLSPEQAKELADVAAQPPRPEARPTPPTKAEHLTKAKNLFSLSDDGDDGATTAIGDIPRGVRIGQLCATELREQLRHSAYPPEILPAYRLPSGTVMDVPHSQFRAAGQWYNLSFRCEVDEDGTRVVSFAFNIGEAVPRSQWRSRGFPEE